MPPTPQHDRLARLIAEAAAKIEELDELDDAMAIDDIFLAAASHWRQRSEKFRLAPSK